MNDLKAKSDSPAGLGLIAAHIDEIQPVLEKHELNHAKKQEKFLKRDCLKLFSGRRHPNELRQTPPDEHRLGAIYSMALECATVFLRDKGLLGHSHQRISQNQAAGTEVFHILLLAQRGMGQQGRD